MYTLLGTDFYAFYSAEELTQGLLHVLASALLLNYAPALVVTGSAN